MDTKMIGSKIAKARKEKNISQAQLGQLLFISPQAIGKWERGESVPDIITFNRLAEILGVDLNYFSENFQTMANETLPETLIKQPREQPSQRDRLNWDMSKGNWVDVDFSGLTGIHEKFSSSNMLRCKFAGSDLSGLLLKSNNVNTCDFSDSDFSGSHIQTTYLSDNIFKDCTLKGTEFSGSYVSGCDFTGADFSGVVVKTGGFEKNAIINTVWNHTSFVDTALADMVFEGIIEDCSFDNCAFTRVTFQNVTITNTFFKNKSLKRVKFIDCRVDRMTYAFLKNGKADLSGIELLES